MSTGRTYFPKKVTLVEVGPRDGLQNEFQTVPTALKIKFIDQLTASGLPVIEVTSFVSPQWIPQMADHSEVMTGIQRDPKVRYTALIPNKHGFIDALKANVKEIAVFTAASESFTQKNTNCSIEESLNRITEVMCEAKKNPCPYEPISPVPLDALMKEISPSPKLPTYPNN